MYFLNLLIEAPLPPVNSFPLYVGVWGATNMQEMKASKYPTKHNHPKHYNTVILKIMLLAQEAKQPITKNFSTLRNEHIQHWFLKDCMIH